jgi:hypothetical protein
LETHRPLRQKTRLDAAALRDLLASTYRGARAKERRRAEDLGSMDITSSLDLLSLKAKPRSLREPGLG